MAGVDPSTVKVNIEGELQDWTCNWTFGPCIRDGRFTAVAIWFDATLLGAAEGRPQVVLHTGPDHEGTHWEQVVLVLSSCWALHMDDTVQGRLRVRRHNQRGLAFEVWIDRVGDTADIGHHQRFVMDDE